MGGGSRQAGAKGVGSLQHARNVLCLTVTGGLLWKGTTWELASSWDVLLHCRQKRWPLQASSHLQSLQHLLPALRDHVEASGWLVNVEEDLYVSLRCEGCATCRGRDCLHKAVLTAEEQQGML